VRNKLMMGRSGATGFLTGVSILPIHRLRQPLSARRDQRIDAQDLELLAR
jgi:hypothetical protein